MQIENDYDKRSGVRVACLGSMFGSPPKVGASCHHDRNVGRDRLRGARGDNAFRQDDVDPSIHQRHRKLRQTGDISVAPLRDQHEIASLHPTSTGKSAQECPEVALGRWCSPQEADPSKFLNLSGASSV
jgi:hypothetical protein